MDKSAREAIRPVIAELEQWSRRAAEVLAQRRAVSGAADVSEQVLRGRTVKIDRAGRSAWRVVPLQSSDTAIVKALWERASLPKTTAADDAMLRVLTDDVPRAVAEVGSLLGIRRFFAGSARKQAAEAASQVLHRRHAAITRAGGAARLERLGPSRSPGKAGPLTVQTLLDPRLRFDLVAEHAGADPEVLDRTLVAALPGALQAISKVVAGEESFRAAARAAGDTIRREEAQRILQGMPVEALKAATRDRLRLGPLSAAGITTVHDVLRRGDALQQLPGVGEISARRMLGAARALWKTTYDEMPVRIDIANRRPETTELLRRLAEWDACRVTQGAAADLERAAELAPLRTAITIHTSHVLVIPAPPNVVAGFQESIQIVRRRSEQLGMASARGGARVDPWDDFLARPADYFAMLAELGFVIEDENAAHGDLPQEIIEAVRNQALSGEHLTASLRGYQSFAARFALVQRKVIIGDEMGLGKTVEALAVLAHLRSRGNTHFLVVCPAAVVTNWVREVTGKSKLRAHRVHGPDRDRAARTWTRDGGVAVTTYETLAWWEPELAKLSDLACVVVDEAHYIKNPLAKRTIRAKALISGTARAILLTGTPLENRVEEFRNLASYVRPDLTVDATDLSPRTFRRQIAPAYLRRNQEDVLTELPELVEVEEWLPMSVADDARYRDAVDQGNFMQMRQAAMLEGPRSAKLQRLIDIAGEAGANGRRVIVFSYFRQVLDLAARSLPGPVFGPLTGVVAANQRQQMIDEFSAAKHGAVLVAQIVAGGIGLNIQSASVVVICEPQLKPTTEAQAIARAHRMGQVQSVQVHRLLSEDSVDQRIVELLAHKRRVFADFARVSDTANSAPEAVDLSEAELTRQVVAAERERLARPAAQT